MTDRTQQGGLQIATELYTLIDQEIAPGTGVTSAHFWDQFEAILNEFGPRNEALLRDRDTMQAKVDRYHAERSGEPHDAADYKAFLQEIGYLLPPADVKPITTANVDTEIAEQA
ncbi:MAG: malate synthase G, partial [Saccharospirillum sp.]